MKIVILGASGLIGGNMLRHYESYPGFKVVGTHFSFSTTDTVAFDTLNPSNPENFDILDFNPDWIIHCGALSWVDYCEEHPKESYEKTVLSTKNALAIAARLRIPFLYISTDYVFDGESGPYREDHPTNPISVYAKHKLEAEELVLNANPKNLVLRVTNVYGDEIRMKNFIARLLTNLQKGEPQTLYLPNDQYATPVNALDVAKAAQLLIIDGKSGVYNIASTDYVNRVQLAQKVLDYFPHHNMTIVPKSTSEINPPAPRPLFGGLISHKFLSEYPDFQLTNVDDYLKTKTKDER
jgi:dTDP-4-dehydrorhamnose reductase